MPKENSDQEPKQIRGRFQKGQSGNPGGRPKVALAWKDECRAFVEQAGGWERLKRMAGSPDDSTAFRALQLIVEYAYGKPQQHLDAKLEHSGGVTIYLPQRKGV